MRPFILFCILLPTLTVAQTLATAPVQPPAQPPPNSQPPLHDRIDRLIESAQFGPVAPPASDYEFIRRACLTLTGLTPTAAETRAFVADPSLAKRAALIDRLLASPAFPRRLAIAFDVMLMERRPDVSVPSADWRKYLEASFIANKPLDQLAREILSSDGTDPALRPAAKFVLDRNVEPNLLTRDVARIFFGRDLQCAQCHDHPLIDSYLQSEYYGLYSFFSRSSLFTEPTKKTNFIADAAAGEVTFTSVFKKKVTHNAKPHVPAGPEIPDPPIAAGKEYTVKPAANVRPIPAYSRRLQLATQATSNNPIFNRNIANRLFAIVMGRGFVDPPDMEHARNPAANPALSNLLASEIAANKFDARAFIREVALTRAFARSFDLPSQVAAHVESAKAQLPQLESDYLRLYALVKQKQELLSSAEEQLATVTKTQMAATADLTKANAALAEAKKIATLSAAAVAAPTQAHAAKQANLTAVAEALAKTQEALKKIPNDKDLTDAAAALARKNTQLTTELTPLKAALDTATAAAKAAQDKVPPAQQAAEAALAKSTAADKQVESFKQPHAAAFADWAAHQTAATVAERKLNSARALAESGRLSAIAQASAAAASKLSTDLGAARQSATPLAAALAARQSDMASLEKPLADAARALADSQQRLAARRDVINTILEAAAKAELARQKLPDSPDIATAAAKLKTVAEPFAAELAAFQKEIAAREAAHRDIATRLASAQTARTAANSELDAANKRIASLETQLKSATDKFTADRSAADVAFEKVTQLWTRQLTTSPLEPLSPEQLCWSTMQALGILDQQRPSVIAELDKKTPLTEAQKKDPAALAARAIEVDRGLYAKLAQFEGTFVRLFSPGPAQAQEDFIATADQALFYSNDGVIRSWLAPGSGNLTERLIKTTDPKALADEMYLSILTRPPTDSESAEVVKYLAARPTQRQAAIIEMAWGLVSSSEFRFRH